MLLMTKYLEKKIPETMETEGELDPMVWVKLFTPWAGWTWYIIEYDPEDKSCFGYVKGYENELGTFNLAELEQLEGPMGLKIERDIHFKPCKLSEVMEG